MESKEKELVELTEALIGMLKKAGKENSAAWAENELKRIKGEEHRKPVIS